MVKRDLLLLALVFLGPYMLRRWEGALPGDSGVYAAVAKGMVDRGDWVELRFGDERYLKKPPLMFWLSAVGMVLWGRDSFGACLLPRLSMLGLALGLYAFLAAEGHRREGFWAAAILLATRGFVRNSHLRMEPLVCTFVILAILGAVWARRRPWTLAFIGLAAGLGFMTKSVTGLWPLLIGLPAAAILGPRRSLLRPALWLGSAGGILIALPWHIAMSQRYGSVFWEHYLRNEVWQRIVPNGSFAYDSPLVYVASFAMNFLPGLPLLAGSLYLAARRRMGIPRGLALFLLIWTVLGIVLPLIPRTKYARYLLYLYLPLSVYAGFFLARALPVLAEPAVKRWLAAGLIGVYLFLASVPVDFRGYDRSGVQELVPVFRHYADRGYETYLYRHKFSREKAALIVYADIYPRRLRDDADLATVPRGLLLSRMPLPGRTPLVASRHYGVYEVGP